MSTFPSHGVYLSFSVSASLGPLVPTLKFSEATGLLGHGLNPESHFLLGDLGLYLSLRAASYCRAGAPERVHTEPSPSPTLRLSCPGWPCLCFFAL